jgi:hypothetical protein
MARIIYTALVQSIRGSIAGTTFQSNAYGYSAKSKQRTIQSSTPEQALLRQIMHFVTRSWTTITQAGRDNWTVFAAAYPQYSKKNPDSPISGFAAYVKFNVASIFWSGLGTAVDTAPVLVQPDPDPFTFELLRDGANFKIDKVFQTGDESYRIALYMTAPQKQSQSYKYQQTRIVGKFYNANGLTDLTANYIAKFGRVPAIGEYVSYRAQFITDSGGIVYNVIGQSEEVVSI